MVVAELSPDLARFASSKDQNSLDGGLQDDQATVTNLHSVISSQTTHDNNHLLP